MTTIFAKSILASRHTQRPDTRVDSLLLRYPKCIHAELMTHRCFSRNAASSRAIPVEKMIQSVLDDPFIPLHWGANQKGMKAREECSTLVADWQNGGVDHKLSNEDAWLLARDTAVAAARSFSAAGYHKQIVNRLLEPFSHITVVVTSTEWENFFKQRIHPDAEPHMRMLAEKIKEAIDGASVQTLQPGEWHLPFVDGSRTRVCTAVGNKIKLSVARCASTSYKTVDGVDMTLERATALYDKLVTADPPHLSPFEHVCQADHWYDGSEKWSHPEQHGNFTGFRQLRKQIESKR
jgi:hypothetical protein